MLSLRKTSYLETSQEAANSLFWHTNLWHTHLLLFSMAVPVPLVLMSAKICFACFFKFFYLDVVYLFIIQEPSIYSNSSCKLKQELKVPINTLECVNSFQSSSPVQ